MIGGGPFFKSETGSARKKQKDKPSAREAYVADGDFTVLTLHGADQREESNIIEFAVGSRPKKDDSESFDQGDFRVAVQSIPVTIANECSAPVDVFVLFFYADGNGYGDWLALQPDSSIKAAEVPPGKFYIYAESKSIGAEWVGESNFCFGNGDCLAEVDMSGATGGYTYTFFCGTETPTPAPRPSTPTKATPMSEKDTAWLHAHNQRRQSFHGNYKKTYIPLEWSGDLATSAQAYANRLIAINGCVIRHGQQNDRYGGENLAANWGSHQPASPHSVLIRWVDNESTLGYGRNGHFTQVVWRGTKFVGCGEASKSYDGAKCHIQVCRYLSPGNCNIGPDNWEEKMLADTSPCQPRCPNDKCK